ncbi:ATP-binding cassette domain-containing protein [Aquibium sp. A9E412]|uniref:ABC transporter ATP-binding protein n=1 Tax=Aquibium sp. A9E412 TaxID=2976767 RepID=UPI0025B187ED|nr:oligopeptide/dipeptide ABC transporter ATP-binding protein [Aquibium sp. A9E412]MDN2567182.1 ATP-binding cassette domain-containing protein [Aquibium sp. A9E412]
MSAVETRKDRAAAAGAPLLAVRGLTKHFPVGRSLLGSGRAAVRAVEAVDFDVAAGEVVGVVGESGSGKSTLGRLVLRLIEATAGEVRFDGQDLGALDAGALRRFRRHFQMIFQDPISSLNARMTVGDILSEPLRLHFGMTRADAADAAVRLLEQVGLGAQHMARYPRSFSGGQGQRIAVARALASSPRFIVADEPVSALDVSVQAEVVNLLRGLQRELGLALMFISHDLSVVEVIADRVVVLYLGRIMEVAPTEALYRRPAHPYTAALLQAVPGAVPPENRVLLKGEIPSPAAPPSGCVFRTRCPFAIDACAGDVPALREIAPNQFKACIRDDLSL